MPITSVVNNYHESMMNLCETLAIMNVGTVFTEAFMSSSSDESVMASILVDGTFGLSFLSESGLVSFITVWGLGRLFLFGVFLKNESIFCCLFIPISI